MKFKGNAIANLLFLAVFIAYVMSPLMFPSTERKMGIMPVDIKDSSSKPLHVSFEKLIWLKFSHNAGEKASSESGIIVHKSRSLIPEDKIFKQLRMYNLCASEEEARSVVHYSSCLRFETDSCKAPSPGFRLLSSGLSPPPV